MAKKEEVKTSSSHLQEEKKEEKKSLNVNVTNKGVRPIILGKKGNLLEVLHPRRTKKIKRTLFESLSKTYKELKEV
ncbi:hypothetical protein GF396_04545 [Candidatus Pacearchaeota archaeon]|nr:hypothetical protein [Candidatus Pacearchaeota archaeon]